MGIESELDFLTAAPVAPAAVAAVEEEPVEEIVVEEGMAGKYSRMSKLLHHTDIKEHKEMMLSEGLPASIKAALLAVRDTVAGLKDEDADQKIRDLAVEIIGAFKDKPEDDKADGASAGGTLEFAAAAAESKITKAKKSVNEAQDPIETALEAALLAFAEAKKSLSGEELHRWVADMLAYVDGPAVPSAPPAPPGMPAAASMDDFGLSGDMSLDNLGLEELPEAPAGEEAEEAEEETKE